MRANPRNTRVWEKFNDFQTLNDPKLEKMKDAAASMADDIFANRSPRWLSLLGTSGAGKSMLAKTILRLFRTHRHGHIDQGRTSPRQIVRWRGGYMNWGKALNQMLDGDYKFLDDLRSYDFFVLDDIISEYEKLRQLSAAKLYDIFESRLGKWTIITANASLEQIGHMLDPRIASRMLRGNSVVVDIDVPDYNLRAKP